jgi:hypothetical protein
MSPVKKHIDKYAPETLDGRTKEILLEDLAREKEENALLIAATAPEDAYYQSLLEEQDELIQTEQRIRSTMK